MIVAVITGVCAWLFLIVYEIIQVKAVKSGIKFNPFLLIGTLLLIVSWFFTETAYWSGEKVLFLSPLMRSLFGAVLFVLGCIYYYYCFQFPKDSEESGTHERKTSAAGLYAKCRHPGFFAFLVLSVGLTILAGSWVAALFFASHFILNFLYIVLQDTYFFPRYLNGYGDYKQAVPFLKIFK